MEEIISILIIEDEEQICKQFENIIYSYPELHLVSTTNSSATGISYLREYQPDVVILDLELHKGSGSGLDFLKYVKNNSLTLKPFVIVTTNNSSPMTHKFVHEMGCDFIMSKYEDDYSERKVIDLIITMKSIIAHNRLTSASEHNLHETPIIKEQRLRRIVTGSLNKVGINPKFLGCKYLVDAIILIIENSEADIGNEIGNKYKKTPASVIRAMQNAIDNAWKNTSTDDLETYYTARIDINRGAPTITEFVYYYAEKIKMDNNL